MVNYWSNYYIFRCTYRWIVAQHNYSHEPEFMQVCVELHFEQPRKRFDTPYPYWYGWMLLPPQTNVYETSERQSPIDTVTWMLLPPRDDDFHRRF